MATKTKGTRKKVLALAKKLGADVSFAADTRDSLDVQIGAPELKHWSASSTNGLYRSVEFPTAKESDGSTWAERAVWGPLLEDMSDGLIDCPNHPEGCEACGNEEISESGERYGGDCDCGETPCDAEGR